MTNPQYSLFNQPSFTVPRNRHKGNQEILDSYRRHFSIQTKWFLEQLLKGRKMTGLIAWDEFNIQDSRARVYVLKRKLKMDISEEKVTGGNGAKAWFMTIDQREKARGILKEMEI